MAIVTSTIFSSIKGSIGGITFYTSLNGMQARVKNNLINCKTLSQLEARAQFSSSSNRWRLFSSAEKQAWNTWASSNFYSLRNPESSSRTGYAAYRSSVNVMNSMNLKSIVFTAKFLPSLGNALIRQIPFDEDGFCQQAKIVSSIQDAPGSMYPLLFTPGDFHADGNIEFDIIIGLIPHVMSTCGEFIASNDIGMYFTLFLSTAGNSVSFRPKNYYSKLIFSSGCFDFNPGSLVGSSGVRISADVSSNLSGSKYGMTSGMYYYVSLVAVGANYTQTIISRKIVRVID